MSEIKTLKNHAFRWLTGALASVMFVVLLGGYRWHIRTTDAKLSERSAPMQELTQRLLSSSGSDDSLLGSSIAAKEALISGLQLTPSVDAELRRYISSIYSAAGAYDNAKASLPQTNDWTYLFQRGTIDLLQSNSFLSGDVLGLYSGRQTIQSAIAYLSGAAMSTSNTEKKRMSEHNLSVALASQIGIEITLCTTSYSALASGWSDILETTSGLLASYQRQQGILNTLKTNDPKTAQCLAAYKNELLTNSAELTKRLPVFEKLSALAAAKNNAYAKSPLQCPLGIDLYDDIVTVR